MKYLHVLILIAFCGTFVFAQNAAPKKNQTSEVETAAIYVPADKRHQGLSRYDLIPFTDRIKGDIDRYRAVNPNFVKRENGKYFYALTVKKDTHFYDENLTDKGVLTDSKVEVALSQTKKSGKEKYVYVKDKGYVLSSQIEPTHEEINSGCWFMFPLKTGEIGLYDGTGIERGKLAAKSIKLNYGLQKDIGGETYYYAFATKMKLKNGETVGASGWIKALAIAAGNDPQFDQKFVGKMQMPTAANDIFTAYQITGGEPQAKTSAGNYQFGYADKNGNYIAYKVLLKIPLGGKQSIAVTDYLKRGDDVINLGFNPAGVSNDTFRISGANHPLIFYRSAEKDATVQIDMFYAKDETHSGEEIAGKMIFVYGYVAVQNGKRWGWIPLAALRLKQN
ncbi:MAG: hypothetical protein ACR2GD_09490 [Pyrinomonadaceae bacterium]